MSEKKVVFRAETPVLINLATDSLRRRFTPSGGEVESADSILKHYLRSTPGKNGSDPDTLDYYMQFVGLLIHGKKYVYINASCRKPDYFQENTYYPKGGGHCYFQALVDPISRRVERFGFNAPK